MPKICQAMQIQHDPVHNAPLWIWMGPGAESWKVSEDARGIDVFPDGDRDGRKLTGRPGDWVIKLSDGSLTIASGFGDWDA